MKPSSISHAGRILLLGDESASAEAIRRAADVIASGGLVVYPTETVYGIGADAHDPGALARIPRAKGRDDRKPIIVLVGSSEGVAEFASSVSATAAELMRIFWPGPLTLVFPARPDVPELLTAGTGTIGLRWSPNRVCRDLIRCSGRAITSTSANRSGNPTPASVADIARELGEEVDLYLDAGALEGRLPSTVVDVSGPVPRVVREGAIGAREVLPVIRPDP
jgi:L-threonylcarbamoyladenylate synthase